MADHLPPRDIYIAVMRAADRRTGLHLTGDEVAQLALDDAIATRAANALSASEAAQLFESKTLTWSKVDPRAERQPANYVVGED